ncbi:GtrA family protein [Paenibacillus sp. GCM10027626]|uniref:GtrA family protein n=1 Tax=Paenibacillus sp. GCM10027626 TaxID=3273411 RepID=UPI003631FCB6
MTEFLRKFDRQFIRFLFVGGLNTIFGYAVFSLFLYFNFHYTIASLLSTLLGILFNFKTIGRLVFENKNNRLFYRFMAVYLIMYLLNILLLKLLSSVFSNLYYLAAVLIIPMAILSFLLNKSIVFRRIHEEKN